MSVLADTDILIGIKTGKIVMFPESLKNVRGSSVDLTLGRNFYRCGQIPRSDQTDGLCRTRPKFLNPFSPDSVEEYFTGPYMLKPYRSVARRISELPLTQRFEGLPTSWPVLVLRPRERILAHTHEFFGVHPPGTSEMRARSSWGRLGIAVCLCAGWGDPGYINRWTMEIHNTNDCYVIIPFGERICQMIVHQSSMSREHYGTEELYESKYQNAGTIEDVVQAWEPSMMLPKAWKDSRVPPLPVGREEEDSW